MQLKIEQSALKKEKDSDSKARLKDLESQIKDVEIEEKKLADEWRATQKKMAALSDAMTELDGVKNEITIAMRNSDFEKVSSLQYGIVPELEKKIAELEKAGGEDFKTVMPIQIEAVVSKWTGVPVAKLSADEQSKLMDLESQLRKRVIGQDHALSSVAKAVRRSRAGLSNPNRPIASFMFLGPTGVGKTELAKALAENLFDSETAMTRIDMSEYMDAHNVSRLIGSPPGYVGYDQGGALTESVRRRPYQVILFDEIEKAHPAVMKIFLQIFEDGRLTDGQGNIVNFTNTIIIMTSNIKDMHAVKKQFLPEFINRVDEFIFFNSLNIKEMPGIIERQLKGLSTRLAERRITLHVTAKAIEWLAYNGFDMDYGARPLRRFITNMLEDPISDMILIGKVSDGGIINVDVKGKELIVN
jgi:ATP-dependent Clp protease ATP-binding subunit ClpB